MTPAATSEAAGGSTCAGEPGADRPEPEDDVPRLLEEESYTKAKEVLVYNSVAEFQEKRLTQQLNLDAPFLVKGVETVVKLRYSNPELRSTVDFFEAEMSKRQKASPKLVRGRSHPRETSAEGAQAVTLDAKSNIPEPVGQRVR